MQYLNGIEYVDTPTRVTQFPQTIEPENKCFQQKMFPKIAG